MSNRVTARPRNPPREFIVLVGGPCNTFNGYTMVSPINGETVAMPMPASLDWVRAYIGPPQGEANPLEISTHDLYWANFIEPVHRLFKRRIIEPLAGDMGRRST